MRQKSEITIAIEAAVESMTNTTFTCKDVVDTANVLLDEPTDANRVSATLFMLHRGGIIKKHSKIGRAIVYVLADTTTSASVIEPKEEVVTITKEKYEFLLEQSQTVQVLEQRVEHLQGRVNELLLREETVRRAAFEAARSRFNQVSDKYNALKQAVKQLAE